MSDWIALSKVLPVLASPFSLGLLILMGGSLLALFRRQRAALWMTVVGLLTLVLPAMPPVGMRLAAGLEGEFPPLSVTDSAEADVIILLGGDVALPLSPRLASEIHGNRTLHAFRLFRAGKAPYLLITGGNAFPQEGVHPEAHYTAQILKEWGVPAEALIIEQRSRNTRQNAVASSELIKKRGFKRVLLVTSALHMPRAVGAFRAVGLDVVPSPTHFRAVRRNQPKLLDWIPTLRGLSRFIQASREYLGLAVYRYRGWIKRVPPRSTLGAVTPRQGVGQGSGDGE